VKKDTKDTLFEIILELAWGHLPQARQPCSAHLRNEGVEQLRAAPRLAAPQRADRVQQLPLQRVDAAAFRVLARR
jgi:hypothetical protein